MKKLSPGLYGIFTVESESPLSSQHWQKLRTVLACGLPCLQLRDKRTTHFATKLYTAKQMRRLTHQYGCQLIINDDPYLALFSQAEGVHLGQQDADITHSRALLGNKAIIGSTCHNNLQLAKQAEQQGADYVAFGCFFPSKSKPNAQVAEIPILQLAKQQLKIPVVAIGGITSQNCRPLLAAGANCIAVGNALFATTQPAQSTIEFLAAVSDSPCCSTSNCRPNGTGACFA